jgi:hypothetical protein
MQVKYYITMSINMFDNLPFNIKLPVNLVNIYLPYFVTVSVIINVCST